MCQWIGHPSKRKTTLNILNWKVIFHVHIWEWIVAICNYNTVQQYNTMNDVRNFAAVKKYILLLFTNLENQKKTDTHTHTRWEKVFRYLPLKKHLNMSKRGCFLMQFSERPYGKGPSPQADPIRRKGCNSFGRSLVTWNCGGPFWLLEVLWQAMLEGF